jgi:hypothetical protein
VFEGSWGNWAVEVKTGGFDVHAPKGLLEFCRRNPKFTPSVITAPGSESVPRRHGMHSVSWEEFLVSGTPKWDSPHSFANFGHQLTGTVVGSSDDGNFRKAFLFPKNLLLAVATREKSVSSHLFERKM